MLSHRPKGDPNFSTASFTARGAFAGGFRDTSQARALEEGRAQAGTGLSGANEDDDEMEKNRRTPILHM